MQGTPPPDTGQPARPVGVDVPRNPRYGQPLVIGAVFVAVGALGGLGLLLTGHPAAAAPYYGATAHALNVTMTGSGLGTITSNPSGIVCGPICSAALGAGTVTLEAQAAQGSTFISWTGACSGGESCSVAMDQARSVGATFIAPGGSAGEPVTISDPCCGSVTFVQTDEWHLVPAGEAAAGASDDGLLLWVGFAQRATPPRDASTVVTAFADGDEGPGGTPWVSQANFSDASETDAASWPQDDLRTGIIGAAELDYEGQLPADQGAAGVAGIIMSFVRNDGAELVVVVEVPESTTILDTSASWGPVVKTALDSFAVV